MTHRPPTAITHALCGAWWTGTRPCHCANCHRTLSSRSAFELHQRGWTPGTPCTDPAAQGLIAASKPYGTLWSLPTHGSGNPHAGAEGRPSDAAQRLERSRQAPTVGAAIIALIPGAAGVVRP